MTKSAPLRRPSTRRCAECHESRPTGHFTSHAVLDTKPGRWTRIAHETCKTCREGSRALPGRAMR